MALIIFLLIIGLPILELAVLIDVGGDIGAIQTVFLCLLTAAIGLSLVRMQGIKVFQDMQLKAQAGEPAGDSLVHGFFLLIAGIFLFIPGFITDFFGALLLVPFIRIALGKAGMAHMVVRTRAQGNPFAQSRSHHSETYQETIIIDGEFTSEKDSETAEPAPEIEVIPPKKDNNR